MLGLVGTPLEMIRSSAFDCRGQGNLRRPGRDSLPSSLSPGLGYPDPILMGTGQQGLTTSYECLEEGVREQEGRTKVKEEMQQLGYGWNEPADPVPGRKLVSAAQVFFCFCADKAAGFHRSFPMGMDSPWSGKGAGEGPPLCWLVCAHTLSHSAHTASISDFTDSGYTQPPKTPSVHLPACRPLSLVPQSPH